MVQQLHSTEGIVQQGRSRWFALVVIAIAQLMIVLDATIMNIALPSAQRSLHFSVVDRQWVVTAYALAFGGLLLLGGKLADLFGPKNTFLTGMVGFAAMSAMGGAATNFGLLVTARAGQGVFAALLAPAALSLLTSTFTDPLERGKAFAVYGAVAGAGGAVGLLLGGLLTEYLSWRWCLYVNLLFAALGGVGALVFIRGKSTRHRSPLDLPGAGLVSVGMFSLVYGFANAGNHGWRPTETWGFLVAGAALLVVFILWQARAGFPLLPLRIPASRTRGPAYLAVLFSGSGMFGILLFLNFYMQQNLDFSPVRTGLAFLPMVAALVASTNLANVVLMPRVGPRPVLAGGLLVSATASAWLTRLDLQSSYAAGILPGVVLAGAGFGLIFAPAVTAGTHGVPRHQTGVASATINAGQQLGGSIGTAVLNTLFASAVTTYVSAHTHGRPSGHVTQLAELHGYTTAFWWCAGILATGALLTAALMRSGPLRSDPAINSLPTSQIPSAPNTAQEPS